MAQRPLAAVVALVVVTIGLGSFALRLERETDFSSYAPGGPAGEALTEVQQDFGTAGPVLQVMVDAGEDGNVLSGSGLERTATAVEAMTAAVGDRAADAEQPVQSYVAPIRTALERAGLGPDPEPEQLSQVVTAVLDSPAGEQLAGLLSPDLDVQSANARAGLAVLPLAADLSDDEAVDAALDVRSAVRAADLGDATAHVIGEPLLEQASAELTRSELPRLLGFSLLLITVVLALVFRNVADVAVGLVGLFLALTWTYGAGALLGPGWLGLTGPFNQITTVVPVLVAGLGIDFALHLTTRRREERTERSPRSSSRRAIATVGGALLLTTITTSIGFLTNLASPLPPIRDFGVFTAVGVVASFVVMIVLVPATRELLDRRREDADEEPEPAANDEVEAPLPFIGAIAGFSIAHPVAVLCATVAVSVAAVVAGTSVPTTFSTDDFIPDGSRAAAAVEAVEERFGDDVSERTYLLLDGPLTDVEAANALAALPARLGEVEAVRTALGAPQVQTSLSLLPQLVATDPELGQRLQQLGYAEGSFTEGADVGAVYDLIRDRAPQRADRFFDDDGRQLAIASTTAGQDGAEQLVDRLDEQLSPLEDVGVSTQVTSQQLVFSRTVDALTSSQLRSIGITVGAAASLLIGYFWWRERSPLLGAVAMVPTVVVAAWVVGSMWVLGLSFDVLTITIGSIAIAIGIDYGIHIAHRFREERERRDVDDAIRHTVEQTGGALAGSAATTAAGFGVLVLSSIVPIRQFGIITAMTIAYSIIAAVLIVPAILHLRWGDRSGG